MIPLVFGMVSARWFSQAFNIFKEHEERKSKGLLDVSEFNFGGKMKAKKYTEFKPDKNVLNVIKLYEEGGFRNVKTVAYTSKADSNPTIGFGTVYLFNNSFKSVRKVRPNERLSDIKREFGMSHLSDIEAAERFVINHLGRSDGYMVVAKILDNVGVPFNEGLAIALYDFSFNSGKAFFSDGKVRNEVYNFARAVKMANWDKNKIAVLYVKLRFDYLVNKVPASMYNSNINGWARRIYHCAKRINGTAGNYSAVGKETAYKGLFNEFLYLVPRSRVNKKNLSKR